MRKNHNLEVSIPDFEIFKKSLPLVMDTCLLIIIVAFIILVVMYCIKSTGYNNESFYFPPSMIQAGDGYQAPGAIVDQGFETDIADYEYGEGQDLGL